MLLQDFDSAGLVVPNLEHLPSYQAALRAGWSPDNLRRQAAAEHLASMAADAAAFLAAHNDPMGQAGPIALPDGSAVPRLPSITRWIWDGEFCGLISLRWQPNSPDLPNHVPGHIGFTIIPGKRRRGYTRHTLSLMLNEARAIGLPHVDLTTVPDNHASQAVILACGGTVLRQAEKPASLGGGTAIWLRIKLI